MAALDDLKSKISSSPKIRQYVALAAILGGVIGVSALIGLIDGNKRADRKVKEQQPEVSLMRSEKISGVEQFEVTLKSLQRQIEELSAVKQGNADREKELQDKIASLQKQVDEALKVATQAALTPAADGQASAPVFTVGGGTSGGSGKPTDLSAPLPLPGATPTVPPVGTGAPAASLPGTTPVAPSAAPEPAQPSEPPRREIKIGMIDANGSGFDPVKFAEKKKEEFAKEFAPKKDPTVFMPAGSMFSAVLLTGVDMPTSAATQQSPVPVVFRVKREAILPNYASIDVRECFLLGSGYGQLSSERAILRAEALTCVTNKGKVLEAPFQAFVVGPDGKVGIPGRLVSKQGAMIARALVGGIFSGLAGGAQPSAVPRLNLGQKDLWTNPDIEQITRSGFAGGMQTAANSIAQFYLQMAKETFPVIEISAGEAATIVVTVGGALPLKGSTNLRPVDDSAGEQAKPAGAAAQGKQPEAPLQPVATEQPKGAKTPGGAQQPAWSAGAGFGKPQPQTPAGLGGVTEVVNQAIQRVTGNQ